jgi:hypothetical protein
MSTADPDDGLSDEQRAEMIRHKADLTRQYGERAVKLGSCIGKLRNSMAAMRDINDPAQRYVLFLQAAMSLAEFVEATIPTLDEVKAITACAERIDSLIDVSLLDSVEQAGIKLPDYPDVFKNLKK